MSDLESGEESSYVTHSPPQRRLQKLQAIGFRLWPLKRRVDIGDTDSETASDVEGEIIPSRFPKEATEVQSRPPGR
jgi:hypothetical protein